MGNKLRVGMLCKFKQPGQVYWSGAADFLAKEQDGLGAWYAQLEVAFQKRHVTVIAKRGAKRNNKWVSYCQILGIDKAGNPATAWVLSHKLKECQPSLSSQLSD